MGVRPSLPPDFSENTKRHYRTATMERFHQSLHPWLLLFTPRREPSLKPLPLPFRVCVCISVIQQKKFVRYSFSPRIVWDSYGYNCNLLEKNYLRLRVSVCTSAIQQKKLVRYNFSPRLVWIYKK